MGDRAQAVDVLLKELQSRPGISREELLKEKRRVSKLYKLSTVIKNPELMEKVGEDSSGLRQTLSIKDVRRLSGVAVFAIMIKPAWCPGQCIYCPGGINFGTPKSYTGKEPAARRAAQNDFDSFRQVQARLRQFELIGHPAEKCELIIQGGTFNALPYEYQQSFVKGAYDGFNGFVSATLADAISFNETAKHRLVGLTFETRPDYCSEKDLRSFLEYGVTRIELGVQSLDEVVLEKTKRGHSLQDVVSATKRSKDAFYKMVYHMMPGLFSTPEMDVADFKQLFSNPDYKPDMLKIYPCLVIPGTPLYDLWKNGEFTPYTSEQAAEVIAEAKKFVPRYCRIMRVNRDIPSNMIADGVLMTNLRELVAEKAAEKGIVCQCIRCREAGQKMRNEGFQLNYDAVGLKRIDYEASGGTEVFLSFEETEHDALLGFLRLRKPSDDASMPEIGQDTAGIRELHVYGESLPLRRTGSAKLKAGDSRPGSGYSRVQHEGYGSMLLAEAERIAREEFGSDRMLVISGVGVREYYRKRGYDRVGPYMGKSLKN